ncbi:hypothetical protein J7L06_05055 [Candidatus Bathyarchaeota archaeon]|nr:hypothetical protein [Candidatus Bathyarchaeota archaeon]
MTRRLAVTKSKIAALSAMFGALAIVFTQLWIPLYFGNPNLGSTPVTLAGILCPLPVGIAAGIIKGIGASLWTGQPFIEMPAGIGDALMAALANRLSRRWGKRARVAVVAQLSRYVFTSGMIALYIGVIVSLGSAGPEAAVFQALLKRFPWFAQSMSFLPASIADVLIVWIAIFPAVTLSIVANTLVSAIVVVSAGKRIENFLKA